VNTKPISFEEYQKIAQLTAMYPGKGENILYPALGLCGEASELYEKYCEWPIWLSTKTDPAPIEQNPEEVSLILKECGDWLWYMADIATELNVGMWRGWHRCTIQPTKSFSENILELCYYSGRVAEEAKKQLRDDKKIHRDLIIESLYSGLDIIKLVANGYTKSEIGIYVVAHMNNEKLLARRANGTIQGSGDNR
jgi:hypothetical protein